MYRSCAAFALGQSRLQSGLQALQVLGHPGPPAKLEHRMSTGRGRLHTAPVWRYPAEQATENKGPLQLFACCHAFVPLGVATSKIPTLGSR